MARRREEDAAFDARMGFGVLGDTGTAAAVGERVGYLYQMLPAVVTSEDRLEHAALDMYFIQEDGVAFKGTLAYNPYFYVALQVRTRGSLFSLPRSHSLVLICRSVLTLVQ